MATNFIPHGYPEAYQVNAYTYIDALWSKGTHFLGTRYALLGGAMTWISDAGLVSAISNAGGFGVLACGALSPKQLSEEIQATRALTSLPFGVNLITLAPEIEALIEVCQAERMRHIFFAGGLPQSSWIQACHKENQQVVAFASSIPLAHKLVRMGVDALILEGSEAGGHISATSSLVLAQEILPMHYDVPIFMAGGLGRGEGVLACLEMGALGCQLGTRFACAHESKAHEAFKKAFYRASSRNATVSTQLDPLFPVIPVRSLTNQGTRLFMEKQKQVIELFKGGALTQQEAQLEIEHFWAGALRRAALEGDVDGGSLMAGQSVSFVKGPQTCHDIIQEILQQAVVHLMRRPPLNMTG